MENAHRDHCFSPFIFTQKEILAANSSLKSNSPAASKICKNKGYNTLRNLKKMSCIYFHTQSLGWLSTAFLDVIWVWYRISIALTLMLIHIVYIL